MLIWHTSLTALTLKAKMHWFEKLVLWSHASLKAETRWTLGACILLDFPLVVSSFNVHFRAIDKHLHVRASFWIKQHVLFESQDFRSDLFCTGPLRFPDNAAKSPAHKLLQYFQHNSFLKRSLHLLPQIFQMGTLLMEQIVLLQAFLFGTSH